MTYFTTQAGWFTLACLVFAVLLFIGFVTLGYPGRIARTFAATLPEFHFPYGKDCFGAFVHRLGKQGLDLYRKQLAWDALFATLFAIPFVALLDAVWAGSLEPHALLEPLRVLVFLPLLSLVSDLLEDVLLLRTLSHGTSSGDGREKQWQAEKEPYPDEPQSKPDAGRGRGLLVGAQAATGLKFGSLGLSAILLVAGGGMRIANAATGSNGPIPNYAEGNVESHSTPPVVSIDFRMADRIRDPDKNHVFGYLPADEIQAPTFEVTLIACQSSDTASHFKWTVKEQSGHPFHFESSDCETNVKLPEGTYDVSLTVTFRDGRSVATEDAIEVQDWLIVSIGDSFASGEGAPEAGLIAGRDARWKNRQCHRSSLAGAPQAALDLEQGDPRSSVTLVHVACTGAQVQKGLISPQDARKGGGKAIPQIRQVAELIGARKIDALLVSIGGNDIGFAPLIVQCALRRCGNQKDTATVHQKLNDLFEGGGSMAGIPALIRCISSPECRPGVPGLEIPPDKLFATTYPDPTQREKRGDTVSCRYITITPKELTWANKEVLEPLNRGMLKAWSMRFAHVIKINDRHWQEHGICARDSWFQSLGRSLLRQAGRLGTFHPNAVGYRSGYAGTIVRVLRTAGIGVPTSG